MIFFFKLLFILIFKKNQNKTGNENQSCVNSFFPKINLLQEPEADVSWVRGGAWLIAARTQYF